MELSVAREIFKNWLEHIKSHQEDVNEADTIMAAIEAMLLATEGGNENGL